MACAAAWPRRRPPLEQLVAADPYRVAGQKPDRGPGTGARSETFAALKNTLLGNREDRAFWIEKCENRSYWSCMDQAAVAALIIASRAVAEGISFDMNGVVIGGRFVGGNGGLISVATLKKVDELRRAISAIEQSAGAE